jgi:hypothetical protein
MQEIEAFKLTEYGLKVLRGTHGFNSWRLKCSGCGKQFTDEDVGGTVVSIRTKRHPFPKEYYHLKCFDFSKPLC